MLSTDIYFIVLWVELMKQITVRYFVWQVRSAVNEANMEDTFDNPTFSSQEILKK